MKEAILVFLAFILGIAFEKFSRWSLEDNCPRVYLGYNCRGSKCNHSDDAWDAIMDCDPKPEDERGFWKGPQ